MSSLFKVSQRVKIVKKESIVVNVRDFGQKPSKNLKGNDKIAVTAKLLSDFLFFYVEETKCCGVVEENVSMPEDGFASFLKIAS